MKEDEVMSEIWIYTLGKQRFILNLLKSICKEKIPEYENYKKRREEKWRCKISNMWLLAYAVPILIGLLWLYLFFQSI
jgi:cytoskeletal protein RodZ